MIVEPSRALCQILLLCVAWWCAAPAAPAQGSVVTPITSRACAVDLRSTGQMSDVLSNALCRGLGLPEPDVRALLENAHARCATGQELLVAAAQFFELEESRLAAEVERFRHCNRTHEGGERHVPPKAVNGSVPAAAREVVEVSAFAANVVLHVVLHEIGHALIREFDLPVLGNEETMADAFATHFLTTHLPDRAPAVLEARTRSLMLEAGDVPREQWSVRGEHDNDARRAFQIAALAVAADPAKYAAVARIVAMKDADIRQARDYGADIHRSWRRALVPLWMTGGTPSTEARLVCGDGVELTIDGGAPPLLAELRAALGRFDWHSQVTIRFVAGDGGANWSRGARSITVHSGYIQRFVEQGKKAERR